MYSIQRARYFSITLKWQFHLCATSLAVFCSISSISKYFILHLTILQYFWVCCSILQLFCIIPGRFASPGADCGTFARLCAARNSRLFLSPSLQLRLLLKVSFSGCHRLNWTCPPPGREYMCSLTEQTSFHRFTTAFASERFFLFRTQRVSSVEC